MLDKCKIYNENCMRLNVGSFEREVLKVRGREVKVMTC